MVRDVKDTMFFVLGLVAIACVLRCHITETSWQRYEREVAMKRPLYRAEITEFEVQELIKLWPQFMEQPFAKDMMVSYHAGSLLDALDRTTKYWFIRRRWDANRFFYVQQRVVSILKYLEIKYNADAIIKQLSRRRNDLAAIEMIKIQKQRLKESTYDKQELEIVERYQVLLKKLFP